MMYYETYYVMANKQILCLCDGKDIFNSHYSSLQCHISYVILDHKTSLKSQFFTIEIYTSPESW